LSGPLACPCCGARLDPTPVISGPDRLHGTPGPFEVAVCASCRAGVTLPPLGPSDLAAFYPETYGPYETAEAGLYARVSGMIRRLQSRRALQTAPLRALAGRPPGRAVDVGCGRGDLGAFMVEDGWRVTGIEPSADACAAARARGVDAREGTIEDVDLEPGAYDAAIFRHSLEHVTDPVAALRRVHTALRPEGQLLISVPNFDSWQRRRFSSRWYHLDLPRHRVHFSRRGLSSAVERAGFEPPELSTSTTPVGLPATIQYAVAGRCLFPSGLPLRVAVALTVLAWPLARLADGLRGGGDVLDAATRRA
jgi:SAM-dependent methyltransferase